MTVVAGGLITLEYAAEGLKYKGVGEFANTARDADLTVYIKAATPVIEDIVGPVLPVSLVRTFDGGVASILLNHKVNDVEFVTVDDVDVDFVYSPSSNVVYAGTSSALSAFRGGIESVAVTYTVGYTPVPSTLQLAARELVRFWVQQGNQAQRPSFSDGVQADSLTPMGFAVPRRVMELCAPYRSIGGFA